MFFISLENINISLFAMILSLSAAESLYSGIKSTAANFVLLFLVAVYYFINGKYLTTLLKFVSLKNFLLNSSYYITLSLYSFTENPLILPDKSSLVRNFKKIEINSINFFCPTSHPTCGYSPLPCYQGKLWFEMPLEEVELIDKEKGIAGGFKRKTTARSSLHLSVLETAFPSSSFSRPVTTTRSPASRPDRISTSSPMPSPT